MSRLSPSRKQKLLTHPLFVAAVAVGCTLLWGTAFPCIKIGYQLFHIGSGDIPSTLIFAGARFSLAGVIVLLIGLCISPRKMRLHKRDLLPVTLLALLQTYLQYLLLYIGLVRVSGTKSSLLTSVAAFGSVVLSAVCFRSDRMTIRKIVGCLVGISGIVVINLGGDLGGFSLLGDGLVILSNLSGAAGNIVSKKFASGRSPVQLAGWQLLVGGSALIVTGFSCGGRLVFYDLSCVLMLLYLAAMAGIAFMLWTMLLFHNEVSRVAVFNLLIPVFGTMWSGLFLKENIFTLVNLLSLLLVCGGIFLVNIPFKTKGSVSHVGNHP